MTATTRLQPRRFESLDMCRGAACLGIIFYHFALNYMEMTKEQLNDGSATKLLQLFRHLWIGVPIFFVISGYCIMAAADKLRNRPRNLGAYFVRRFRRIFPPYWILLAISVVVVAVIDVVISPGLLSTQPRAQLRPWWFSPSQWLGNVTLTETWRHHVFGSQRVHFVGQSWTLCYEEQFYLVVGIILAFSSARPFLAASVVTLLCVCVQFAAKYYGVSVSGFFFDGAWLMFAAGILAYWQINYSSRFGFGFSSVLLLAALCGGIFLDLPLSQGTIIAWIFTLSLPLLHLFDTEVTHARWLAPLRICGVMCYSLYLVHELVLQIVQRSLIAMGVVSLNATILISMPIAIGFSLTLGWLFYVGVERRFLNGPVTAEKPDNASVKPEQLIAAS